MRPPRVTSSRVVYENRWMRLREDTLERADGSPGLYAVVEKQAAALTIPVDGEDVILVEQYRYPVGARHWEAPQGTHEGGAQDAERLARAELAEETGMRAGSMERLGTLYFAYGFSDQPFDVWLATELTPGPQALDPEEEGLRVGRFPLSRVEEMIRANEIQDSATVAAFGLLRLQRPK